MPLEDLEALGYRVSRPPDDLLPPMSPVVAGHGQQWSLQPNQSEDELVYEITNHSKLVTKMATAQDYFANAYANWPTMTAAQKDAAMRNTMRAMANLIRHVRGDLTSEGV